LRYAYERWGEKQRRADADLIDATLSHLATFPGLGRPRNDLAPALRSHPFGQHVAFYRVTDEELIVVRRATERSDAPTRPSHDANATGGPLKTRPRTSRLGDGRDGRTPRI
jgi:plasmid stabilization system protein ParE